MTQSIVYGLGGYDPSKPNDNIVEIIDLPDDPVTIDSAKEAAMAKLRKLGLTDEEIQAVVGN
jgi:hypothetical protein